MRIQNLILGFKGLRCFGFRYANECLLGHMPLPNFKPRAAGYESDYYGINNKRKEETKNYKFLEFDFDRAYIE